MTMLCSHLIHIRLKYGRLVSKMVTLFSESFLLNKDDVGLPGIPKNPYWSVRHKVLPSITSRCWSYDGWPPPTKSKRWVHRGVARKGSAKHSLGTTLWTWDQILFSYIWSLSQIAYAVQSQLRRMDGKWKKFIRLAGVDICKNVWYVIHGVSQFVYHVYKANAKVGYILKSHRNKWFVRPLLYTIQAKASIALIINQNADQLQNKFQVITKRQVGNLKALPSTMN